jgi:hypothetical protein
MVSIPIIIMQTIHVTIDSSIACQKLSSTYQMYSQKGATILMNPAQTQYWNLMGSRFGRNVLLQFGH